MCQVLTGCVAGLEHATIRDNIIFGSAYGYDERRYQAVIEACALTRDLEIFEAGDMTGTFEVISIGRSFSMVRRNW